MSLKFKPTDFMNGRIEYDWMQHAADIANAKFQQWLASQPDVFLAKGHGHFDAWTLNDTDLDAPATHTARLVDIEEINK